jgi:hypothetical protein
MRVALLGKWKRRCLAIFGTCDRYKEWLYGVGGCSFGEDDRDVKRKTTLTGSRAQSPGP